MIDLSKYIVEKLHLDKDTKIVSDEPKNVNELVDFIEKYLEDKYNIPSEDKRIMINYSSKYFSIDVYLDEKYKDDYLYAYFTTLRSVIEKTPMGKYLCESWSDNTTARFHYKFEKCND